MNYTIVIAPGCLIRKCPQIGTAAEPQSPIALASHLECMALHICSSSSSSSSSSSRIQKD